MTALRLRPVRHGKNGDANRFCGPSAISAVTGMTTGEAARVIRSVTGKRQVTGTTDTAIRRALLMCNIRSTSIFIPSIRIPDPKWSSGYRVEKPTLAAWFKDRADLRTAGRTFLISADKHWQVVSGRRFVCGITGEVVPLDHAEVRRRAKVRAVWELTLAGASVVKPSCAKAEAKPKPPARKRKAKAKRAPRATAESLLRDLRIEVEGFEIDKALQRRIDGFLKRRGMGIGGTQ